MPGLVEDVVWNADFANVVQQGAHLELVHVAFGDAEVARHQQPPLRQTSAVKAGIQVTQVEQLIEAADEAAVQLADLVLQIFDLKLLPAKN